jgi:hypothetical protein
LALPITQDDSTSIPEQFATREESEMVTFLTHRAGLVCLIALIAVAALLAESLPAGAAPTDRKEDDQFLVVTIDQTDTIPAGEACAFAVVAHVAGWVKVHFTENEGNEAVEIDSAHIKLLWENPLSGKTSDVSANNTAKIYLNPDGTLTVIVSGVIGRNTIPGEGIIVGDIGRFAFTVDPATGEVLDVQFLAGHHHTEGPFPELCEFLA